MGYDFSYQQKNIPGLRLPCFAGVTDWIQGSLWCQKHQKFQIVFF